MFTEVLVVKTEGEGATGIYQTDAKILLNLLQSTEHPPTTKNYLVPNVNRTEIKKSYVRCNATKLHYKFQLGNTFAATFKVTFVLRKNN